MTYTRKPNRYAGTCENCNRHVGAGEGYLVGKNHARGRWLIAHNDCAAVEAEVRGHIAEARQNLAAIDPANVDEAIHALREDHIMLAEIDNIFPAGSEEERNHLAAMRKIEAEIDRLETLKDNIAEASLAAADRREAEALGV